MSTRTLRTLLVIIVAFATPVQWISGGQPAHAAPGYNRTVFASPRFQKVWSEADAAVANEQARRSWTWGPSPWFDYREFYKQAPNGLRLVQYFDKARMEINDPANTGGPLGGVTNGLLPVEMVAGRVKLGDGIGPDQYEPRAPAEIPVAGDPLNENPDAPTYRSFRAVATTDNGYRDSNRVGQRVGTTLAKDGVVGFRQELAQTRGTEIVVYEAATGHNVPRVFDDFRKSGPVPAIVAFGHPITDPYWVVARVGTSGVRQGRDLDVLVQIFERRVITYTPANPSVFQVEMGNVGQHYFQWRYPHLGGIGQPWHLPVSSFYDFEGILFASKQTSNQLTMHRMDLQGAHQQPLQQPSPATDFSTAPYSLLRSWELDGDWVFGASTRFTRDPDQRQIVRQRYTYAPSPQPSYRLVRVMESGADDHHPAVSPDGKKLVFASNRDGNMELYLASLPDDESPVRMIPIRLTQTQGCTVEYPDWLPDGSGLVYASDCEGGNWEIYVARLQYRQDRGDEIAVGRLIGPGDPELMRLTRNTVPDRFPRVSPDGQSIAFERDGQIFLMQIDGTGVRQLTTAGAHQSPTWSTNGDQVAFASDRGGDWEIYTRSILGPGESQLTRNSVEDRFPVWAP